jgi:hypothetical protein
MPEKTMFGEFFLIEQDDGSSKRAERLTFGETSGRDETWLRNTLFDHPELLPVRDIDSSFGPLIPLCKELQTKAGPLDLAFIDPNGHLTLVECKLWRNPEARRKVVAQVLHYSHHTSSERFTPRNQSALPAKTCARATRFSSRVSRFASINANCAPLTAPTAGRPGLPGTVFAFNTPLIEWEEGTSTCRPATRPVERNGSAMPLESRID